MKRNKKIVKRLLGLFLCLTILLSYVPEVSLTVMAADDTKCVKSDCNGTYVNGFCDKCDGYQPATEVYGVYEIANARDDMKVTKVLVCGPDEQSAVSMSGDPCQ